MLILGDLKTQIRIEDISFILLDEMLRDLQHIAFFLSSKLLEIQFCTLNFITTRHTFGLGVILKFSHLSKFDDFLPGFMP